jgi:hypothetical protein
VRFIVCSEEQIERADINSKTPPRPRGRHRPHHSVFYAVNRELFPRWIFGWRKSRRVDVELDSHLPLGASHHEKVIVVDDKVAYCGGIDLTLRRWGTREHRPVEPRRCDPKNKPYVPVHDADVSASIGISQPGFYGQINIGDFPRPRVIYAQPVWIQRPPKVVYVQPIYVRVATGPREALGKALRTVRRVRPAGLFRAGGLVSDLLRASLPSPERPRQGQW